MSPAAIIGEAAADGVSLALSSAGTIKATGDQAAVNRWLPVLREHKAAILAELACPDRLPPVPRGLGGYTTPPGVPPLGDCELARQVRSMPEHVPGAKTSDLREHFEERAAILEHDAGLPRAQAEVEAAAHHWRAGAEPQVRVGALRSAFAGYPELLTSCPTGRAQWMPYAWIYARSPCKRAGAWCGRER